MTQLELPLITGPERTQNCSCVDEEKYYIIRLDSYYGEHSSLTCSADDEDYMFTVLIVHGNQASLIDYGYSSIKQLLEAWNNVNFVNLDSVIEEHNRYKQHESVIRKFRSKSVLL